MKTWSITSYLILLLPVVYAQYQQQQQQYTTPVPILKQIDRHNDDGSYTYGYEAADKSFKIETKYPNGEVYGKYGYLDDQGKLREIEYGASKRGFEPAGSDINVPPPTLTSSNPYPLGPNEMDDGQYREDPSVYFKDQKYNRPIASQFSFNSFQQPQQQREQQAPQYYNPPPQQQGLQQPPFHQPAYQQPAFQQSAYKPPQPYYQPQYQQTQYQSQPQYNNNNYNNGVPNHHHPALKNIDIWSGSYSIDYTGRK